MYKDSMIGIEMQYERGQPSVWVDIFGNVIPKEKLDEITYKYCMPPEQDQRILGNYWWIVRLRPHGNANKYEYMINKQYSYRRVAEDFARMKTLRLSANRYYFEMAFEKTSNLCLYPYYKYCPGLDIDFSRCNINLQLHELQYTEETKEPQKNPQCLQPNNEEG
jgi:hypothetical protein